jgi:streptogramin lyase
VAIISNTEDADSGDAEAYLDPRRGRGRGRGYGRGRGRGYAALALAVVAAVALLIAVLGQRSAPVAAVGARPSGQARGADTAASRLVAEQQARRLAPSTSAAVPILTPPKNTTTAEAGTATTRPSAAPSTPRAASAAKGGSSVSGPVPEPFPPPISLPPVSVPPPSARVTLFPVAAAESQPFGIVSGPDGNLWFTEGNRDVVGRITPEGVITEYHTPTALSQPGALTVGPDGNIWFTEMSGNNIGRITTAGAFTEFPIPTPYSNPRDIAVGPDGALWFTETNVGKVSRVTVNGHMTEYSAGTATPVQIVAGADGDLWFTDGTSSLGRISPNGTLSPVAVAHLGMVLELTVDHAGNLWYAGIGQSSPYSAVIGRRDPAGHVTEFVVPPHVDFGGITEGPDGAMWFTESNMNTVGRLAADGTITTDSVPSPVSVAAGPDGNMWITSGTNGNAVARLRIR